MQINQYVDELMMATRNSRLPPGDEDLPGTFPIDPPVETVEPADLPGSFPIDPPVETVDPTDLPGSFPIDPPVETVNPADLPGDFPIPVPEPDDSKG
jgi:hypothetical protein